MAEREPGRRCWWWGLGLVLREATCNNLVEVCKDLWAVADVVALSAVVAHNLGLWGSLSHGRRRVWKLLLGVNLTVQLCYCHKALKHVKFARPPYALTAAHRTTVDQQCRPEGASLLVLRRISQQIQYSPPRQALKVLRPLEADWHPN